MSYQWLTLWGYLPDFIRAGWLTLQITLLAFCLALALGLVAALASAARVRALRLAASCYIELIRNTPFLIQIFMIVHKIAKQRPLVLELFKVRFYQQDFQLIVIETKDHTVDRDTDDPIVLELSQDHFDILLTAGSFVRERRTIVRYNFMVHSITKLGI